MPASGNEEQHDTCIIPAVVVLFSRSNKSKLPLQTSSPSLAIRLVFSCAPDSIAALQLSAFSFRLALDPLLLSITRMARTKTATATTGRNQRNGGAMVVKNRVPPAVRFADMRANTGKRFSIAGAKMSEKMTYFRANVMLKLHLLQHRSHPVKRVAATETVRNMKAAATERRRQKVARATDVAARKRAVVRERRAAAMARHA